MKQILSLSLVLIIVMAVVGCVGPGSSGGAVSGGTETESTQQSTTDESELLTAEQLTFFNENYFDILFEQEGYYVSFSEGFRMEDEVKLTFRGYEPETGDIYEMMEHIITLKQDGEDYIYISHEPLV